MSRSTFVLIGPAQSRRRSSTWSLMPSINILNSLMVASSERSQLSREESFNLTKYVTNIKIPSGRKLHCGIVDFIYLSGLIDSTLFHIEQQPFKRGMLWAFALESYD